MAIPYNLLVWPLQKKTLIFQLKKSTGSDSRKNSKPTILNLNQATPTHILFIPLRYCGEL